MAETTINSRGYITNGVSIGKVYTLTATDAANTAINFNFNSEYTVNWPMVASAVLRDASGNVVNVTTKSFAITYPANGVVKIDKGTYTSEWAEGAFIDLIVQRSN
jgi:hypothetical protein